MIHPLLHLVTKQPGLLADHAEAYAELVSQEFGAMSVRFKTRTALYAAGMCSLSVSAALAGVALMLWAVTPPADISAPWALIVSPLVPLIAAAVFIASAKARDPQKPFANVRRQVQADVEMLREASAS